MHPALKSPRHAQVCFSAPDLALIEIERAKFKNAGLAENTVVSYGRDWRVFEAWCAAAGKTPMPASADTLELYISDMLVRGRRVTTLERHTASIHHRHRIARMESPCGPAVRALLAGAKRLLGQQPAQKDAITVDQLRAMVRKTGSHTAVAARNSALLLLGFASALRRSTLAGLRLEQLRFTSEGLLVWIDREKQDRKGEGRQLAIPRGRRNTTCPVRAIERWLKYRGKESGRLFCAVIRGCPIVSKRIAGNRVAQIVQDAAAAIGLDRRRIGAHSLRAGMASTAFERGAGEIAIAAVTGHRALSSLRGYIRRNSVWSNNASSLLGL